MEAVGGNGAKKYVVKLMLGVRWLWGRYRARIVSRDSPCINGSGFNITVEKYIMSAKGIIR